MRDFPHLVIRASAGTGKTFQLSNRFIGLISREVPLDTLLATTFTRKAAGEILDRVLLRLAEAGLDPPALSELKKHVKAFDRDTTGCLELLKGMLTRLHRIRVGTLDSFFNRLAQSFSLELELLPGWRIVDEIADKKLRTEAVQSLLENGATSDTAHMMYLLNRGESWRSVSDQIQDLVCALYGTFLEAPPEAWRQLKRRKLLTRKELDKALADLAEAPLPENKHFKNALKADQERFSRGDWESFVNTGLAGKIVQKDLLYHRKPIEEELQRVYAPLIRHAGAVLVNRLADQTEATAQLLERFDAAYHQLKLSRRALRFDDVTRMLTGERLASQMDEVAFRLDAHVTHLMLDEFQDTSPLQWRVLKPFAHDVIQGRERSFFCVGDVKQAIYSWRGGVPEIFEAINKEFESLAHETLNLSFRASPPVMDAVNLTFKGLEGNPAMEKQMAAARAWAARFEPHESAYPELPGYCLLEETGVAREGEDQKEMVWRHAGERIAALHRLAPERTVGVLVRTNDAVARLIYELRSKQQIEASEEGGNPLTDSPAVELMLSLLKIADHPGDLASRYHVARSPLAEAVGFTNRGDAHRLSMEIRRRLLNEGYGPTLHAWTEALSGFLDERDFDRLLQLVELAYGFESEATLRTSDFIDMVNEKRVESPSTARVRVMTIHQAKGLGFDAVVLPQLDTRLFNDQRPLLAAGRSHPAETIDRLCRYVSKSGNVRGLLPEPFQRIFTERERQAVEESLCVLYVAMTRAKHALYMIIPPAKGSARFDGLLRAALSSNDSHGEDRLLFQCGDAQWFEKIDAVPSVPPKTREKTTKILFAKRSRQPARGLERLSPSALEGGGLVDLKQRLKPESSGLLNEGSLIHAWFEQVEWLEEGEPDEELLLNEALDHAGLNVPSLLARFYKMIRRPTLRALLERKSYGSGKVEVWRERPFAIREGAHLLSGKIDRLVAVCDESGPRSAEVIDFKTDAVSADNLEARVETYRPQIEAYIRAAARLLGMEERNVKGRLVFTAADKIVEL